MHVHVYGFAMLKSVHSRPRKYKDTYFYYLITTLYYYTILPYYLLYYLITYLTLTSYFECSGNLRCAVPRRS